MAEGDLLFGATDIRIEGQPLRRYVLDCEHGTTDLLLEHRTAADDLEVLPRLIDRHRIAIEETERIECRCLPRNRP